MLARAQITSRVQSNRKRMRSQWFHARLDATIHDHAKADAMTASRLFSPITLRGLTLDNRIVLSPMCQYASQDGNPSPWHTVHLGTYALANLGLAITEATAVEPAGRISPMCLGLYSDAHQEALAHIVRFYREFGTTKFGVQLWLRVLMSAAMIIACSIFLSRGLPTWFIFSPI
jgi:hypothetical protein